MYPTYKRPVYPEAEITEITNITDSSATFKILVTREPNSALDELILCLDTIAFQSVYQIGIREEKLQDPISIGTISWLVDSLKNNTHYFSKLLFFGDFMEYESKLEYIGEQKEFTTLP